MKSKTFSSPISMCSLQRVTRKTLLSYKLKVNTQTLTKDFITLCPEYEIIERIKKSQIKEIIKVNNEKRDRIRTFKKIMIKSSSDAMILNMIMKNKKFSNYVKNSNMKYNVNSKKEMLNSSSLLLLHHRFNLPIKSNNKDSTFITNVKQIQQSDNDEHPSTSNGYRRQSEVSDIKINKYLRAKKKFSNYIPSRSQSSRLPLTTSQIKGSDKSLQTIDKIEKLSQPTLIKLNDLRCTIRKGKIRKNINTEREIRHQRILNEMRDIEVV